MVQGVGLLKRGFGTFPIFTFRTYSLQNCVMHLKIFFATIILCKKSFKVV